MNVKNGPQNFLFPSLSSSSFFLIASLTLQQFLYYLKIYIYTTTYTKVDKDVQNLQCQLKLYL